MFDISGRLVNTQTIYVTKGTNNEMINVATLASGTYMIKAEFNGTQAHHIFLIILKSPACWRDFFFN